MKGLEALGALIVAITVGGLALASTLSIVILVITITSTIVTVKAARRIYIGKCPVVEISPNMDSITVLCYDTVQRVMVSKALKSQLQTGSLIDIWVSRNRKKFYSKSGKITPLKVIILVILWLLSIIAASIAISSIINIIQISLSL